MLQSRVPNDAQGLSLVDWLVRRFTYFDAAQWQAHLAAQRIERNGAPATAQDVLQAGDRIVFQPAPAATPNAPVPILHVDEDLIAVDKPAHLVAHAHSTFAQHTFLSEVAARCGHDPKALSFVHRLDRETSGVLLLARHAAANRQLTQQFQDGTVRKRYLALVHGRVTPTTLRIDAPIGPAEHSAVRVRQAVRLVAARGVRSACTEVTVVQHFAAHTLLAVHPLTGRTHQIRVHLEHLGHPIVGDKLYGQSEARYLDYVRHLKADGDPAWPGQLPTGRHMLHAAELDCTLPGRAERLCLRAPIPADLRDVLAALGQPGAGDPSERPEQLSGQ